jgi:hypothetical protein
MQNGRPRSRTLLNYAGPGCADLESVWVIAVARDRLVRDRVTIAMDGGGRQRTRMDSLPQAMCAAGASAAALAYLG